MKESTDNVLPALGRILGGLGDRLKTARLRRRYSADTVAQRAGIARATLYRIEQGDPGVSLGNYARVLQVLRLEQDLSRLAADDALGRKLQDAALGTRARVPRRKAPTVSDSALERAQYPAPALEAVAEPKEEQTESR
jgi:transcriptional regulator with XRE-family HTH domain